MELKIPYSVYSQKETEGFVCPPICSLQANVDSEVPGYFQTFPDTTMSLRHRKALIKVAKLPTMTSYDYLTSADLIERKPYIRRMRGPMSKGLLLY